MCKKDLTENSRRRSANYVFCFVIPHRICQSRCWHLRIIEENVQWDLWSYLRSLRFLKLFANMKSSFYVTGFVSLFLRRYRLKSRTIFNRVVQSRQRGFVMSQNRFKLGTRVLYVSNLCIRYALSRGFLFLELLMFQTAEKILCPCIWQYQF